MSPTHLQAHLKTAQATARPKLNCVGLRTEIMIYQMKFYRIAIHSDKLICFSFFVNWFELLPSSIKL